MAYSLWSCLLVSMHQPKAFRVFWTLVWQHAIHSCLYFRIPGIKSPNQYLALLVIASNLLIVCPACHCSQTPTCDFVSSSLVLFDLRLLWPGHNLYRRCSNSIDMNRTANPSSSGKRTVVSLGTPAPLDLHSNELFPDCELAPVKHL